MNGYFVHFFAPENLKPLRKHVVFVLDTSGSMWGRRMEQLKKAMSKILADLSTEDFFNILTFSSDVIVS
jgi:secreted protein with Ig-like and vWFA domain